MSRREATWYYAACTQCSAKWFSTTTNQTCPRCGQSVSYVTAEPPWMKHSEQVKTTAKGANDGEAARS